VPAVPVAQQEFLNVTPPLRPGSDPAVIEAAELIENQERKFAQG